MSKALKSEPRELWAARPRYGSSALLDTSNDDTFDLTDSSGSEHSEDNETCNWSPAPKSASASTSKTTETRLKSRTMEHHIDCHDRSLWNRETMHRRFTEPEPVRQHLVSEDSSRRCSSIGTAPSPYLKLWWHRYRPPAMFDISDNSVFHLPDFSDSEYSPSDNGDNDEASTCLTTSVSRSTSDSSIFSSYSAYNSGSYPPSDVDSREYLLYGSEEERKIVHRRFVAPAAIGQHSGWECLRTDGDTDLERILEVACTDARFDTMLGRAVITDDQPCCCQQCVPLSPRSTTPAPPMPEELPEHIELYMDRVDMSLRTCSSSSRRRSLSSYRSSCTHSWDSSEPYVPSGRNLTPIEEAIDPLECEIVDAAFWVWRWPSEFETDTLLDTLPSIDLSGLTSPLSSISAGSSNKSTCGL